jgi:hypothetical protein
MIHQTADFDLHPRDGWYSAQCTCGFTEGPFPDIETMVDALMEHAFHAAYDEMRDLTQKMVSGVTIENSQTNEEVFGFEP